MVSYALAGALAAVSLKRCPADPFAGYANHLTQQVFTLRNQERMLGPAGRFPNEIRQRPFIGVATDHAPIFRHSIPQPNQLGEKVQKTAQVSLFRIHAGYLVGDAFRRYRSLSGMM